MVSVLPLRLLRHVNGEFSVFNPSLEYIDRFDIISYTWVPQILPYNCGIPGVNWNVTISPEKLDDIKRLMIQSSIQYLWVDCLCIQQDNEREKAVEIAKMFEYYKNAQQCHILVDMPEVWNPQDIVDNLKFVDHVVYQMGESALSTDAGLTDVITARLASWANAKWMFLIPQSTVRSAAVDMGVINCYATCISHVRSLFKNLYFSRVWTFQEMILGKNILIWAINRENISCIGELHTWMDLATDSKDKAQKLRNWIDHSRILKTSAVNTILRVIDEDQLSLLRLQVQVMGINAARSDVITGGPHWWHENHKGVSNIFSAISITPRNCGQRADIFRGLLGVFSGLFTAKEIERDMSGDNIETISFNFFRQLSAKTKFAWTKLAISSGERDQWDWIPVVENSSGVMTTDVFAGVVKLGRLESIGWSKTRATTGLISYLRKFMTPEGRLELESQAKAQTTTGLNDTLRKFMTTVVNLGRLESEGRVQAQATTGLKGTPRKFMTIKLLQNTENKDFCFYFKGCNCGKRAKTGMFSTQPIPTHDQPVKISKDETGKALVQCATILGSLIDPGTDVVEYRRRLLGKLRPNWHVSDPSAKPASWEDRCVNGTSWEKPHPALIRTHNQSMNLQMVDIYSCESRLSNDSTARISCQVTIKCGCTIVAPFSLIFEALTAVQGSSLGDTTAELDGDSRIILRDGLGPVQIGDVGKTFKLVAFGGNVNAYKQYADSCKETRLDNPVSREVAWPRGRALVKEEFTHVWRDMFRNYGYVDTEGSGNLLIFRENLINQYRIIGVCIDEEITGRKGRRAVTIR